MTYVADDLGIRHRRETQRMEVKKGFPKSACQSQGRITENPERLSKEKGRNRKPEGRSVEKHHTQRAL